MTTLTISGPVPPLLCQVCNTNSDDPFIESLRDAERFPGPPLVMPLTGERVPARARVGPMLVCREHLEQAKRLPAARPAP